MRLAHKCLTESLCVRSCVAVIVVAVAVLSSCRRHRLQTQTQVDLTENRFSRWICFYFVIYAQKNRVFSGAAQNIVFLPLDAQILIYFCYGLVRQMWIAMLGGKLHAYVRNMKFALIPHVIRPARRHYQPI